MKSVEYAKSVLPKVRSEKRGAAIARDAIVECASPEWRAAHARYRVLCEREQALVSILATLDRANAGEWATMGERELMTLGYF